MKKMMIIAVMMGAMLMPAQMFAKNDRVNERPRVENNQKKKEIRIANERGNRPANKPNKKRAANYRQTKEGVGRSYYAMSEAITAVRACCADTMDLEKYLEEDSENT